MAIASDSVASFRALVKELGLDSLWSKFDDNGWNTFVNFAFSTPDPSCRDVPGFEKEVLPVLLDVEKPEEKKMVPLVRRLFAQSYAVANALMAAEIVNTGADQRVHLTAPDRNDRITTLKGKLTGFELKGQSMPSDVLIDKYVTMLVKGHVVFVPWDKLTSKDLEVEQETEIKGLRLHSEGVLVQDLTPDFKTSLAGEFLWDYAMRRRALATDIAGLCGYSVMERWTEILKNSLLKDPPSGYRKVNWNQLQASDTALWKEVASKCQGKCKADLADLTLDGKTTFEHWFAKSMDSLDVRMPLMFLPGGGGASSSSAPPSGPASSASRLPQSDKMMNRLENLERQNANLKRRLENNDTPRKGGKGNGKGKNGGKRGKQMPNEFSDFSGTTPDGDRICYGFNSKQGCPHAKGTCWKGKHVCIKCFGQHPHTSCPNR